jgi:hypothetical protein
VSVKTKRPRKCSTHLFSASRGPVVGCRARDAAGLMVRKVQSFVHGRAKGYAIAATRYRRAEKALSGYSTTCMPQRNDISFGNPTGEEGERA